MHRLREHPEESKGDPTLWEPFQIRYSNQGLIGSNQRGRGGRRGPTDAVGGVEEGELSFLHVIGKSPRLFYFLRIYDRRRSDVLPLTTTRANARGVDIH